MGTWARKPFCSGLYAKRPPLSCFHSVICLQSGICLAFYTTATLSIAASMDIHCSQPLRQR